MREKAVIAREGRVTSLGGGGGGVRVKRERGGEGGDRYGEGEMY